MTVPPTILATVPVIVIPPLVPIGTLENVVISTGAWETTAVPISEAHVSPQLHANDPSIAMESTEEI